MSEIKLTWDEESAFDVFFASVVSMAHCHPAAGRSNGYGVAPSKTIQECKDIALEMVAVRREVQPVSEWESEMAYDE